MGAGKVATLSEKNVILVEDVKILTSSICRIERQMPVLPDPPQIAARFVQNGFD